MRFGGIFAVGGAPQPRFHWDLAGSNGIERDWAGSFLAPEDSLEPGVKLDRFCVVTWSNSWKPINPKMNIASDKWEKRKKAEKSGKMWPKSGARPRRRGYSAGVKQVIADWRHSSSARQSDPTGPSPASWPITTRHGPHYRFNGPFSIAPIYANPTLMNSICIFTQLIGWWPIQLKFLTSFNQVEWSLIDPYVTHLLTLAHSHTHTHAHTHTPGRARRFTPPFPHWIQQLQRRFRSVQIVRLAFFFWSPPLINSTLQNVQR